jgi:hypothetical protein
MDPLSLIPRWSAPAVRVIVGAVPATLAIAIAMLILLVALFLPTRHQEYALRVQAGVLDLARVLVGITGRPALVPANPERVTERPGKPIT